VLQRILSILSEKKKKTKKKVKEQPTDWEKILPFIHVSEKV